MEAEAAAPPPVTSAPKRDAVTAFFGAVVPKQPEVFKEIEGTAQADADHLKPTIIKKKKE